MRMGTPPPFAHYTRASMPLGKLAMDINSSSSSSDNGRFKFCTVFEYLSRGKYPENFDKKDKLALRKKIKVLHMQRATSIL